LVHGIPGTHPSSRRSHDDLHREDIDSVQKLIRNRNKENQMKFRQAVVDSRSIFFIGQLVSFLLDFQKQHNAADYEFE
jgi:hypothetical protein